MTRRRIRRLSASVAAAALVGGIAGAAIALFSGGSGGETANAAQDAGSAEAVYRGDAPGVVVITATQTQNVPGTLFTPPSTEQVRVLGSGIVIDRAGDIVTNQHVVDNGKGVTVGFSAGATHTAKVLGTDASTDLAVIRVKAPQSALHPLSLADSSRVEVGDTVYAIGNPFGLDRTMTAGIVSGVGRDIRAPNGLAISKAIQTDAAINHGNSGGPLLNDKGEVIGINDQIESGGTVDGNVGVGFAVPSNTVSTIVPQLIATGHALHAWLGVEVATIDAGLRNVVRNLPAHGVLVVGVVKGSPAARAGLKAGTKPITVDGVSALVGGDVIESAAGTDIRSPAELSDVVNAQRPGAEITLDVSRNGQERTLRVQLGTAPR
jgi:S1-C subfamily serine protease